MQLAGLERRIGKLRETGGEAQGELCGLVFEQGCTLLRLGRDKQGAAALDEYIRLDPADARGARSG